MLKHCLCLASLMLVHAAVVQPGSAHAQAENFANLCNAQSQDNLNPIACISNGSTIAVAVNTSDWRSYSTQLFVDPTPQCKELARAHENLDSVSGGCTVDVTAVAPWGATSRMWVSLDNPLKFGQSGDISGVFVHVNAISCNCYGEWHFPPT